MADRSGKLGRGVAAKCFGKVKTTHATDQQQALLSLPFLLGMFCSSPVWLDSETTSAEQLQDWGFVVDFLIGVRFTNSWLN